MRTRSVPPAVSRRNHLTRNLKLHSYVGIALYKLNLIVMEAMPALRPEGSLAEETFKGAAT